MRPVRLPAQDFPFSAITVTGDGGAASAYLDIVNDTEGYDHIALFIPADSNEPIYLTSGSWEVTDKILSFDAEKQVVYVSCF